ncbi:polysaccharide biosynthesis/export family protein [Geofilum rubicundum]|uniref:Polysaccharide export outer membrane protein n=1 Tax=Geofilum rubicundum JCM 15548 TaxID=1236989 RepID=A0A0E9M0L3_9BACT|nr:polysaccharide biosynthesis/export family protein [Geofilum rubicundum]GAO31088.1 polysaccharide export outer membrane protein [Geofilum rubicundum JCM 15548]
MQSIINKSSRTSLLLIFLVIIFNGCIPQKETVYFQDLDDRRGYENPYGELETITEFYLLKPNDALSIRVTTSNPKLSEFFNMGMGNQSNAATSQSPLYTYPIDDHYNIDFPFVGLINLENCTRKEATERIKLALLPFVSDAQVTVRLANPSFIALGETNSRGRISMGKEQVTIYEAIALAGDVRPFGKKKQVKIIRPTKDGSETFHVDLTDNNLLNSDRYYIYPNDIIYIRPMKAKTWGIGESFSFGILTSAIAMYLTLNALFK